MQNLIETVHFLKEEYTEKNTYDLALALLTDGFTDDIKFLSSIVEMMCEDYNLNDVLQAFIDNNENVFNSKQ